MSYCVCWKCNMEEEEEEDLYEEDPDILHDEMKEDLP